MYCIKCSLYTRILQNPAQVKINVWSFILVLDLVHKWQKAFEEISKCEITLKYQKMAEAKQNCLKAKNVANSK